ncbi:MAG TPA: hypothetical protein VMI09_07875 [Candidatus Binataceae bacterium]|jgi:hypothetical protein|nr:hypothetical protein [Candidatus Binataceae bacterium]
MSTQLPTGFSDLEKFAGWALPTSTERNRMRRATPMADINAFYNAMLPRLKEVLGYLDQFSLQEMPQDARALLYLSLALAEITIAVELFHEPKVTGGCDPERFVVVREIDP